MNRWNCITEFHMKSLSMGVGRREFWDSKTESRVNRVQCAPYVVANTSESNSGSADVYLKNGFDS